MAADDVAVRKSHGALAVDTVRKVNLTAPGGRYEIIHHGGDTTTPIFFRTANSEAGLVAAGLGADETDVVLPGERLTLGGQRGAGIWFSLITHVACNFSVVAVS